MDNLKTLDHNRVDSAISLAKSIVGALPYGGALFGEIIGMTIPNQRLDRVVAVLKVLDERLSSIERAHLKTNKYALDLFEDGIQQAARALTAERNKYIATFVRLCTEVDERAYGVKKKLFYILQELTDLDIDILISLENGSASTIEYKLCPKNLTYGEYKKLSDQQKYEYNSRKESWSLHIATLKRHGLIAPEREKPDIDGTNYHIDEDTGLPKIMWYNVTSLGRVFLQSIGEKLRDIS